MKARPHRFRTASVAAVLALAAVAVPVATAQAGQGPSGKAPLTASPQSPIPNSVKLPGGYTSWQAYFDFQTKLDTAATNIEGVAGATPSSGFTSTTVDAATRSLTLYWKGAPSAAEQKAIDATRASGIVIHLQSAKYSQKELDAQVGQIQKDAVGTGGTRVLSITKQTDGSGILVGVSSAPGTAASPHQAAAVSQIGKSLPHLQDAESKVSITVFSTPDSAGAELSREADNSPYFGGALIEQSPYACSSGFAVHWEHDGYDYMTTAAHCEGVGGTWRNGAGAAIGVGTPGNAGYDLEFIRIPSGESSAGYIYTGPRAYAAGQGAMNVSGASHTHVGDSLCTSGSFSGWHCYIRASGPTTDCRETYLGLGCFNVQGGISTVANQCIAAHGDSGGPVWSPVNGFNQPNSTANARGLISSIPVGWTDNTPCGTDPSGKAQTGTTAIWFTDILSGIAPWAATGMYVKTG